jgi:hypothetical protein
MNSKDPKDPINSIDPTKKINQRNSDGLEISGEVGEQLRSL